jgi:hypothetical protein
VSPALRLSMMWMLLYERFDAGLTLLAVLVACRPTCARERTFETRAPRGGIPLADLDYESTGCGIHTTL